MGERVINEEEWIQLEKDEKQTNQITIQMVEPIQSASIEKNDRLEQKEDKSSPSVEEDNFQTEEKELQVAYFSNFLVEYVSVETSRRVSGSIVNSLRSNRRHPDLLLELMLIMKYIRVSGHVKKLLVKKIYLEVYDELDWIQRDCDRLIDQLVLKLPRSFQPTRSCSSFVPDCLKAICFICS
jgi:hypothetical protein